MATIWLSLSSLVHLWSRPWVYGHCLSSYVESMGHWSSSNLRSKSASKCGLWKNGSNRRELAICTLLHTKSPSNLQQEAFDLVDTALDTALHALQSTVHRGYRGQGCHPTLAAYIVPVSKATRTSRSHSWNHPDESHAICHPPATKIDPSCSAQRCIAPINICICLW